MRGKEGRTRRTRGEEFMEEVSGDENKNGGLKGKEERIKDDKRKENEYKRRE